DVVKTYWKKRFTIAGHGQTGDFETFWETSLHDGVVAGTALPQLSVAVGNAGSLTEAPLAANAGGLEIVFRPDPTIGDGRFANNGWLQELPKPLTQLTWDNAALISPRTAQRLGL